jgi:hypothetical protein
MGKPYCRKIIFMRFLFLLQPHIKMIRLLLYALGTLCDIMSSCHEKRCSFSQVGKIYPQAIAGVGVSSPMQKESTLFQKLKRKATQKWTLGLKFWALSSLHSIGALI